MKKNSKGFTLVELLAAIVILGILLVITGPTIINMLNNNRDKMYVEAAKKLIAQAEYQMRASSSKIERPEEGSVIAISLVYLDSSDFDAAPNNGEYLKEASFVIVKNTGNGLEYSSAIVEKLKKGGYKGVELTSDAGLSKRDASKHVKSFKAEDIIYVENATSGTVLTNDYINERLGTSYSNDLEAVYNYPDLGDDVVTDGDESPTIKSVTLKSASNKEFNSMDAILTVKASDDKTPRKDLMIYTSLISYSDALNAGNGEPYGNNDQYTKKFDFSTVHNKYDGYKIELYVVVQDSAGNTAKKKMSYPLHANSAPIINIDPKETYLAKRNTDKVNLPSALLRLSVTDDVDETSKLQVCVTKENSCTEYGTYGEMFDSDGTMIYNFDGVLDGRTEKLHISVKDSSGLETSTDLSYTVYNNAAPAVNGITIDSIGFACSNPDKCPISEGGTLATKVVVNASDDITQNDALKVELTDGVSTETYNYGGPANAMDFRFSGNYDGRNRTLTVKITDSDGAVTTKTQTYKVYGNKKPEITKATVMSAGSACGDEERCPVKNGGSLETRITFEVEDDIDVDDSLKVCVSDSANYCNNVVNFKPYDGNPLFLNITPTDASRPYMGEEKTVHFAVVDSFGLIEKKDVKYKLYKKQVPVISNPKVETEEPVGIDSSILSDFLPMNLNKIKVTLDAEDDFNSNLQVDICKRLSSADVSTEKCDGYKNFAAEYRSTIDDNRYNGQEYKVSIKVKDSYGNVTATDVNYKLAKDKKSLIDSFAVESTEKDFNANTVNVKYHVKDPFDTYKVCIASCHVDKDSTERDCSKNKTYDDCMNSPTKILSEEGLDGNSIDTVEKNNLDTKLEYQTNFESNFEVDKTDIEVFYIVTKDSYDNESKVTRLPDGNDKTMNVPYKMYELCSSRDDSTREITITQPTGTEEIISAERCESKCVSTENRQDGKLITAQVTYFEKFNDRHFNQKSCEKTTEDYVIDCSYLPCFKKGEEADGTKIYYKVIGMVPVTGGKEGYNHIHADGTEHILTNESKYYRVYEVDPTSKKDYPILNELADDIGCEDLYNAGYYNYKNDYVIYEG